MAVLDPVRKELRPTREEVEERTDALLEELLQAAPITWSDAVRFFRALLYGGVAYLLLSQQPYLSGSHSLFAATLALIALGRRTIVIAEVAIGFLTMLAIVPPAWVPRLIGG
jgi:hypothetical protein